MSTKPSVAWSTHPPRVPRLGAQVGIANESDQVTKGHLVDALAVRGDEGRGTLRYAVGRCEQPLIHRSPNGATHLR